MRSSRLLRAFQAIAIAAACLPAAGWTAPLQQQSVKPGINESWKSSNIDPLIQRLETESREIYTERERLAAVVGPAPGAAVADVGAGSGFMTEELARLVGPSGKVYAVDINPTMLKHVADVAKAKGMPNIETIVCSEHSTELPRQSVDLIFVCDTYHHFEYPQDTLASIHAALRPGGQLVVVDFKRIPGESQDFVMEHVRAGQEVFTQEIESAGFRLIGLHPDFLKENYILRFLKVDKP